MKPASIAVTAASGQLGRLVVEQLLQTVPASAVVAVVRDPAKASALSALGVTIRQGDYERPDTLAAAFAGVEKLLLISSNELGRRAAQHRNAVSAAKAAGVELLVYTSLLRADTTPLSLGAEHAATEAAIRESGVPFVILRNGWYAENYTVSIKPALAHGAFVGSAGDGRLSLAARADYAAAAIAALAGRATTGRVYELAGDEAVTLSQLAAEISRQTGKNIPYVNLPEADYAAILAKAGLPPVFAEALARWDVDASHGALFDDGRELSRLIGRPTTPLADYVAAALRA